MFHELMQPSIVAAVGAPGPPETKDSVAEAAGEVPPLPHQFALRSDDDDDEGLLGRSPGSTPGKTPGPTSAQTSCSLTLQLAGLLDTLTRTSRSQDPVLDFLKRAIHSHAIMHPDDVRTFMKAKEPGPQPVHQPNALPKSDEKQVPSASSIANGTITQR